MLYKAATGLERALVDVEAEAMLGIRAELITENWDPWKVQLRNLPFLAWGLGVTLWDEDWSEATKRQWLADQWLWHSRIGTVWAIRRALANWSYELVDYLRPPQGYFASPDFTPEQRHEWLEQMPKLRIRLERSDIGNIGLDQWVEDQGFVDESFAGEDDGWNLYGRRASLRLANGTETTLQVAERTLSERELDTVDLERVYLPGLSTRGFIADEDYIDDERFVCAEEKTPETITIRLDRRRTFTTVDYELASTARPGYEPINVQYTRELDVGEAGPFFFADDDAADIAFTEPDYGGFMLADVIYLLDPAVQSMMTEGFSFAGYSRVGMPTYTAEVLVNVRSTEPQVLWFAEDGFEGDAVASPENTKHLDNAFRAIVASKALRDTVLADFAPVRPLEFGDVIFEETIFGSHRRSLL